MRTESKIYWGVALLSVVIFVVSFLIPGDATTPEDLPWHIDHPTPQTVRVFGLTLGNSTVADAEARFKEQAVPSLFKAHDGSLVAEVFFEQVDLAGLRAKMVVSVGVPADVLKGMYERGLRMSATASSKKITLAPEDVARLRSLPISSLTYMPGVKIDEALFLKRFGKPAEKIQETESGLVHWLYPQNGLDITPGGTEKPLLQYVSPSNFDTLRAPLLSKGKLITP